MPGVRQVPRLTGMGAVAALRNPQSLAKAILEVLSKPEDYRKPKARIVERFSPDIIARRYEALFERVA